MTRPTSTAPARGYELDDAVRRIKERIIRLELTVARRRYAAGTGIADVDGNFIAGEVEGALAELADVLNNASGPPADRALEGTAYSMGTVSGFAVVQSTTQRDTLASFLTLSLAATPTVGNLLVIWHVTRGAPTPTGPSSGWTAHPAGVASAAGAGEHGAMFYRVVQSGDGASWVSNNSGGAQSAAILVEIAGAGLAQASVEVNDAFDSAMSASVTTTGAAVLVGGAVVAVSDTGTDTVAPNAGTTEIAELYSNPSSPRKPTAWLGYKTVPAATTSAIEATISAARNFGMQVLAFAVGEALWNVPEPNVNDGADGTYEEITGPNVVQINLGDWYRITSTRLLIGCATAGAKSYIIQGSVDPSFDPDLSATVATLNFTATGSFTADVVTATWPAGTQYRYFRLTGPDETRRVFTWALFQQPFALTLALDDLVDVNATTPVNGDVLTYNTGSVAWIADGALRELIAKAIGYQAHGAMGATETFNAATGWHSGTFDANCTFSLTAAPTGTVSSLFVELAQDGTGGRAVTLPASVVNRVALEATQDTTAATTSFLVLLSRDGGTNWYGGWWGGSAGLTIKDEGTPLATAATTLDFAGTGVIASGTGVAKTITIPGTPTGAAGGDLSGTYPNPSVVNDSHAHTSATAPGASGDMHGHVDNVVFSGDGSTTAFTLPVAPVDATSVSVYVTASRSQDWTLSGALLDVLTFGTAPPSAANNIVIDIAAELA